MKKMKLPYGISDFGTLVNRNAYYADRTMYLPKLESLGNSYLFFLRPRRFGKSLFISMLHHYYGLEYKDSFTKLFGQYFIGKNPTPLANSYLVLRLDFSGVNTKTEQGTFDSFLDNVHSGIKRFFAQYPDFFTKTDLEDILKETDPTTALQSLFDLVLLNAKKHKIYLLIDEYDHFANELLSFDTERFKDTISRNGFVRKFYERIKVATGIGLVDRLFVTGVAPLTLDSLTSGFNISTDLTLRPDFNDLAGFTKEETKAVLRIAGIEDVELVVSHLKLWYDGYLFNYKSKNRLYNPDMVLYFASYYAEVGDYPDELLDSNIASDYRKIRNVFKIGGKENKNIELLNQLLKEGTVRTSITRQFNLERRFTKSDFISLWFYMGILTINEGNRFAYTFRMPNYVIKQLYYQYFYQIAIEQSHLNVAGIDIGDKVLILAQDDNIQPLIKHTEAILTALSTRDKQGFDEKHIKILFTSMFYNSGIFLVQSEVEVKKGATEKGYIDLLLTAQPTFSEHLEHQFIFELKYLKKSDAQKVEAKKKEAKLQLKAYMEDDKIKDLKGLKGYIVVFVGNKGIVERVT